MRENKEQLLWGKTFCTGAELGDALQAWLVTDHAHGLGERQGVRSPAQGRRDLRTAQEAA